MTDSEQDTLTKSQKAGVYHNAAVAIIIGMFKKAGEYFLKAYRTGGTQPSLVQYLLALKLCENEEPSGMFETGKETASIRRLSAHCVRFAL